MDNKAESSLSSGYYVLARKYRPQSFSDLIGQKHIVRTLKNAFESNRIAHAWMLTGVRGVGKTTTARILARALNYKNEIKNQPSVDLSIPGWHCQAIMTGQHIDVIEMDAASHTGIDDIREIIERIHYPPVSARYKVYIIDEVHMLSNQAFNGLLKTLEEPPPHVKFIFATTEIRKVPLTILSRCQRFDLHRVDCATLIEHLKRISDMEGVKIEEPAVAAIARAGDGSVRDALSILDQAIAHDLGNVCMKTVRNMLGLADNAFIVDLFEHVMSGNITTALRELRQTYSAGIDLTALIIGLADFNHFVTRLKLIPEIFEDIAFPEEYRIRGRDFAKKLSLRFLIRSWQMLLKGITEIEHSTRPLAATEMILIRLTHASELPTLDEVIKNIEEKTDVCIPVEKRNINNLSIDSSNENNISFKTKQNIPFFKNLEEIAQFAEKENEMILAFMLRECVHLVSFKQGYIEFVPTKHASCDLAKKIAQMLKIWTNNAWIVKTVHEGGDKTIAAKEQDKRIELLSNIKNDLEVSTVLELFPGAKIIDVHHINKNNE